MPSDSRFVTILRDPVTMFESIFTYFAYDKIYRIKANSPIKRLNKFLKDPMFWYNMKRAKPYQGHGRNPMLYDLGLDTKFNDNQTYIDDMIIRIDKRFDLVMMAEYFYESLILLKELMCWTLDDIVFLPLNARTKSTVPSNFPTDSAKRIRKWNDGDVKLYNYFNCTFWQKVHNFGVERMKREVQLLKERNTYYHEICIQEVLHNAKDIYHPPHIKIDSFKIKPEMEGDPQCRSMAMSELDFTETLRTKALAAAQAV